MATNTNKEITIAFPGIGLGKPLFAYSLAQWAEESGVTPELVNVLSFPEIDRLKALIILSGYNTLSHVPSPIYSLARRVLDRGNSGNLLDAKTIGKYFREKKLLSVSAVTSTMFGQARLSHSSVVVDFDFPDNLLNEHTFKLFSPYMPDLDTKTSDKVCVVGGIPLPVGFRDIDWEQKRRRLKLGENAVIGFITHGAGDLATVLSLIGMRQPLKEKKVSVVFFVGRCHWMKVCLEALAKSMNVSVGIYGGSKIAEAIEQKMNILPQIDLFVSPVANETASMGPVLVRGVRNSMEAANIKIGSEGGWLRVLKQPATLVWREIEPLFVSGKISSMLLAARRKLNFTAGEKIISEILLRG